LLIDRTQGIAIGPATLVLWRGFAWTTADKMKPSFRLTRTPPHASCAAKAVPVA
jgi:hypothetical protein